MIRNWKFHAGALGIICAIIVVLYLVIGPSEQVPADPDAATGDRFVQVYSATWGMNCNEQIDRENHDRERLRLQPQGAGAGRAAFAPLPPVTADNVLVRIGDKCNGKIACRFNATSEAIGTEPFEACFKRLSIGYRCFTYDRLHTIEVGQGDPVTIDCHEEADSAAS